MRRQRTEKAHGPYRRGKKWRVVETAATGARSTCSFETEAEALDYIAEYNDEAQGRTVSAVIDEYVKHRKKTDLRGSSSETLKYRLHGLLRDVERDRLLTQVTPAVAAELYERRAAERAADTHRGELNAVSQMFAWCVKRGWIETNPFAAVEPTGKKNVRKAKLRIDEARRFVDVALDEGTNEGLAAAIALLMGLRASEVTGIRVRDVDDGGRVLWVDELDGDDARDLKSEDSDRWFEIPEVLRTRVARLCLNRNPNDRLFGDVDRHWLYYHVQRICGGAKVPTISSHALRRTHSKISAEERSVEHVAATLGHAGTKVTKRHYVGKGTEERRKAGNVLRVLAGGKP